MLETMQTELTKEKEADQELYDKLSCWSAGGSRSCCSRAGMFSKLPCSTKNIRKA